MCMLYMYMSQCHDTTRGGEIIGSNRFIGRCEVGYRFRSFVIVAAVTGSNRLNRLWSEPVGVLSATQLQVSGDGPSPLWCRKLTYNSQRAINEPSKHQTDNSLRCALRAGDKSAR